MAINFGTAAMAFGSGLIKGDEKARKEKMLVHGEKLAAKRDAIIAMKKSKFDYDMKKYEGNKSKMDSLTSVQTNWDSGKYNYKDVEGNEKLDAYKLGFAYLQAKHGQAWVKAQKDILTADGIDKDWVSFVTQEGNKPNLRKELENINFKSESVIESNYLESIQKIEDKYASQLENARHDSPLVNAILGKKKEEIANLSIDVEQDDKDVKTIDSATAYIAKKTDIITDTDTIETDITEEVDTGEIELGTEKVANIYSNTFIKKANDKISEAKTYDYSKTESKDIFSSFVLRTIPEADAKKYFKESQKDGTLSAKMGIINAEKTFLSLLKDSAKDLTLNQVGILTDGKTAQIDNYTGINQRHDLAERHIEQYGNWWADGQFLGDSGKWGNLGKKETNILTVPSQSVINMNTNKVQGYDIIIPNNSQVLHPNLINQYTEIKTDKPINMDVRTYVGLVYTKALHNEAIRLQKRDGGDLEVAMNKLQTQMQNDKGGNDALTKRIREIIANSLGVVKETDKVKDETTVTEEIKVPDSIKGEEKELPPPKTNVDKLYEIEMVSDKPGHKSAIIYLPTNQQPEGAVVEIGTLAQALKTLKYAKANKMSWVVRKLEPHIASLRRDIYSEYERKNPAKGIMEMGKGQ